MRCWGIVSFSRQAASKRCLIFRGIKPFNQLKWYSIMSLRFVPLTVSLPNTTSSSTQTGLPVTSIIACVSVILKTLDIKWLLKKLHVDSGKKKIQQHRTFKNMVSSNIGRSGATSNSAPALQAHPGRLSPLAATAAAAGAGSQRPRRRRSLLAAGHGGWPRARRAPSEWHPQWRRPTKLEALRRTWSLIPTAKLAKPLGKWRNGWLLLLDSSQQTRIQTSKWPLCNGSSSLFQPQHTETCL